MKAGNGYKPLMNYMEQAGPFSCDGAVFWCEMRVNRQEVIFQDFI